MKDLYSFHADDAGFKEYYNEIKQVYRNIFDELGIGDSTYVTLASGGDFTNKYSHEFQTICEVGEDIIHIDRNSHIAINSEVWNDETRALFPDADREQVTASEVGNIFPLETKFSKACELTYTTAQNTTEYPIMGSYGIGSSRVMGVIVEKMHDERGILRPQNIAPFALVIIPIGKQGTERAREIYQDLSDAGVDVCIDDRNISP
jgi:prolyl-tRNA synthetase